MLYVDITKRLSGVTLRIQFETDGERMGLFGPSGAGKSMTLKCIAGIEKPDAGRIILNGRTLFDSERRINLSPQERRVGYLFQEYALFPNMTVKGNITAGLHHLPRSERSKRADALMEQFGVTHLSEQHPDTLSGGERQRVALARILASEPELLLLDEPFSSLDTVLKCELISQMRDTVLGYGKGCILVSHDVGEVAALCDKVTAITDGANDAPVDTDVFIERMNAIFDRMEYAPTIFYQSKNNR